MIELSEGNREFHQNEDDLLQILGSNDGIKCEPEISDLIPESCKGEFDLITDFPSVPVYNLCSEEEILPIENIYNESISKSVSDSSEVDLSFSAEVSTFFPKCLEENTSVMSKQLHDDLLTKKGVLDNGNMQEKATCVDNVNKSDTNEIVFKSVDLKKSKNKNRKLDNITNSLPINNNPAGKCQATEKSLCIASTSTEPVETWGKSIPTGKKRKSPLENCVPTKSVRTRNFNSASNIKPEEEESGKYFTEKKVLPTSLNSEYWRVEIKKYVKNNRKFLEFGNGRTKILVGPTGLGKTTFALAHFTHPVLITSRQQFSLIKSDPNVCTGFVIDNAELRSMPATEVLNLLGTRHDTTVDTGYGYANIPAGMPRIVVCTVLGSIINNCWNPKIKMAIHSRCNIFKVISPLYETVARLPNEIIMRNLYTDSNDKYIKENAHLLSNNKK